VQEKRTPQASQRGVTDLSALPLRSSRANRSRRCRPPVDVDQCTHSGIRCRMVHLVREV
jgi:hypothetical protein